MTNTVQFDYPAKILVKHLFAGFEYIIVSRVERINGCLQYLGDRLDKDGEIKSEWLDKECFEVLTKKLPDNPPVEFKFRTGDKVKNLIHKKTGIITVCKHDQNGCIAYYYETGETSPECGKILEFYGFEQEFEFVDNGLNSKEIGRKKTGCVMMDSSGKYKEQSK
jgi:hypothetical protein